MTTIWPVWVEGPNGSTLRILQVPADSPAHALQRTRSQFPAAERTLIDCNPTIIYDIA